MQRPSGEFAARKTLQVKLEFSAAIECGRDHLITLASIQQPSRVSFIARVSCDDVPQSRDISFQLTAMR